MNKKLAHSVDVIKGGIKTNYEIYWELPTSVTQQRLSRNAKR